MGKKYQFKSRVRTVSIDDSGQVSFTFMWTQRIEGKNVIVAFENRNDGMSIGSEMRALDEMSDFIFGINGSNKEAVFLLLPGPGEKTTIIFETDNIKKGPFKIRKIVIGE